MAAKRKNTKSIHAKILDWVREFDGVSVQEVGEEFSISDVEANNILVSLSNDDLVDVEAGMWVALQTEDYTPGENSSESVDADVEDQKSEERKRLEYMAGLRDEQDAVFSQASKNLRVREDSETGDNNAWSADALSDLDSMAKGEVPTVPAVTPVHAADGSKVTVPVDFDDPSKGRRELDASKGERLIGEDTFKVQATPKPERLPEIDGLDQFVDDESGDMVYESRIVKMGLALPEPDSIPQRPEGVNPNMWDHAHTAITQQGRDWAMRQIVESLGITREAFDAMLNAA